jgi:TM2 domain-containing membrane protein YozV
MKYFLVLVSFYIFSVEISQASSFKIDQCRLELTFASAKEISLNEIQIDLLPSSNLNEAQKDKVIAGLLGIVCGGIGLHRFYLGQSEAGFIYLGAFCGLILIGSVSSGFLMPFAFAPHLLGIFDGILYLVATDEEFKQKYLGNQKFIQWL